VTGGVAYSPIPELELEFNTVWINWSKFKELRIQLPDGSETVSPEDYENTFTYRLGAEYQLTDYKAAVRAGFIFDPTPIPRETMTAQLPDINRVNFTLGASKDLGDYGAHLGLLVVTPGDRETSPKPDMPPFKANYGVWAFVAALSISGHFGK
jgi:long-chain fatty acid transport protein